MEVRKREMKNQIEVERKLLKELLMAGVVFQAHVLVDRRI